MKRLNSFLLIVSSGFLTACQMVVLRPSGDVAEQQKDILLMSTWLMLLIIIPVIVATIVFAWRYRQSNKDATYEPDWDHSTKLELLIWSAPLMIIICLGALTWLSTHLLDPYRSLGRIDATRPIVTAQKPLEIDVVALDWKWLFIYPDYGIATINTAAAPIDQPIDFHITASSVMNSFYIPAMAGQIYAMPGMETRLAAVINQPGTYQGFSANYSGAGFSKMKFAFQAFDTNGFAQWVATTKQSSDRLTRDAYLQLKKPSEGEPARGFAHVDTGLFHRILNMCVEPGKMCMHQIAAIDAKGGLGLSGINNVAPLAYDNHILRTAFGPIKTYVAAITCAPNDMTQNGLLAATPSLPQLVDATPLLGAGISRP